jgi:beta-barrel assembly-enhancing protease
MAKARRLSTAILVVAAVLPLTAQTPIKRPKNKYTPEQDVQLGRQAAAEVLKKYPVIKDPKVAAYLDRLGKRLVAATPAEFANPVFEYSFTPVNVKEINAFALPGGPMFVNRGMFDAAGAEGEVVGVMAHELSHVLLRHGTANVTKAEGFQWGQMAGAIAGAVVGGGWGQMISQGSQFGFGTWLLKYSRDYEKQADLLGAQIMARAGYDPRDLGRMFETIAKQSGGGGNPQWMSSHPDPGNRSQYIAKEAAMLQIAQVPPEADFANVKSVFAALPPPRTMAEVENAAASTGGGGEAPAPESVGTIGAPVPAPSAQFTKIQGGKLFEADVPSNWKGLSSNNAIKFVPENGYGSHNGQTVFTHGIQFGIARASTRDLREATKALLSAFAQNNPQLKRAGDVQDLRIAQRSALGIPLANQSSLGKTELIGLYTTFLADGNLFYYVTIVPEEEAATYDPVFEKIGRSIKFKDVQQ